MVTLVWVAVVALWGGLLLTVAESLRRDDAAALVNTVASLAVALFPVALETAVAPALDAGVTVPPELTLALALAGLLHSIGMLGWYDTVWWWDHLTHTLSAGIVAAAVYAVLLVTASAETLPPAGSYVLTRAGVLPLAGEVAWLTLAATFVVGVFWELGELLAREIADVIDVEPVLVHYGWRDTAFDLVFDVVGALLVLALDVRAFLPVVEPYPRLAATLTVAASTAVVVGSVLMAAVVSWCGTRTEG
jgi:hypothetical protein